MAIDQRPQSSAPREDNASGFAVLLTVLFLLLAGLSASRHELWRDEMQAWLIGRDMASPAAVIAQAHYEGAPPLWNLILWGLNRISPAPVLMQLATWLLAGLTFFIVVRWAPFNRLHKLLLLGNYYLLYEYGTVCRNYLPGILALCLACVFLLPSKPRPWLGVLCLVLSGFSSAHTLIIACALTVAFFGLPMVGRIAPLRLAKYIGVEGEAPLIRPALLFIATAVGLLVAAVIARPLPDTYYASAALWNTDWSLTHFARICAAFVASSFPLPRAPGFFWIPPWDMPFPTYSEQHARFAAVLLWLLSVLVFLRSPRALLAYVFGTLGLALFLYTKFLGSFRHTGLLFFAFLFATWILFSAPESPGSGLSKWRQRVPSLLLTLMLAAQALTGLWAVREDYHRPFSGGKNAAEWLRSNGYADAFIAVCPDWAGAPLAGYLNRTLYYPQDRREGSFTRWVRSRDDYITHEEFYARALNAAKGRPMVMISDRNLPEDFCLEHDIQKLVYIAGSLTPFEEYVVYYKKPDPAVLAARHNEPVKSATE